jgi:hypothetical protein
VKNPGSGASQAPNTARRGARLTLRRRADRRNLSDTARGTTRRREKRRREGTGGSIGAVREMQTAARTAPSRTVGGRDGTDGGETPGRRPYATNGETSQQKVDVLAANFFSEPPRETIDDFEWEIEPRRQPLESRIAMMATFAMLAVGLTGIGIYTVYHKMIMPTPVAVGAEVAPVIIPAARVEDSQSLFQRVAMAPPEEARTEPAP